MKPVVLPSLGAKHSPPARRTPLPKAITAGESEIYTISSPIVPAKSLPVAKPITDDAHDFSPSPPAVSLESEDTVPKKKKKKPRRFKRNSDSDSNDESSDFGTRLGAGILMLVIMVIIGAVFGVGKFGWIKSNSIVDFNDKVVSIIERTTSNVDRDLAWAWDERRIQMVHNKITPGIQELNKLSVPSEGREFHAAALRFLQRLDQVFANDIVQLSQQGSRGNRAQAEQQLERLTQELSALEDALIRTQAEMARRNHFELTNGSTTSSTFRRRHTW